MIAAYREPARARGPEFYIGDNLDQNLVAYTVEPNSPSAEALGILASWAATPTNEESTTTVDTATPPADPYVASDN